MIAKVEQAVLRGGLFAMAMPRGSGKTTLAETACIWAMLTGAREFVCLTVSVTLKPAYAAVAPFWHTVP